VTEKDNPMIDGRFSWSKRHVGCGTRVHGNGHPMLFALPKPANVPFGVQNYQVNSRQPQVFDGNCPLPIPEPTRRSLRTKRRTALEISRKAKCMASNDRIIEFDESNSVEHINLMSSHVMPVGNGLLLFRFGSLFDIKNIFPLKTIATDRIRVSHSIANSAK
jgi:hypothetical protein